MNLALQSILQDFRGSQTWAAKCVEKIYHIVSGNGTHEAASILTGIVGQDGVPINVQNSSWTREDIWGISIGLCYSFCSRQRFQMVRAIAIRFVSGSFG